MTNGGIEIKKNGDVTIVELKSPIDEDVMFSTLKAGESKQMKIDFNGVSSINSCGIREWVKWTKTVPESCNLVFMNCPKIIVDQINMIEGFLPKNATVESFQIPYYCEKCDNITSLMMQKDKDYKKDDVSMPSAVKCSKCGGETEIDVNEAKYFKFLKK